MATILVRENITAVQGTYCQLLAISGVLGTELPANYLKNRVAVVEQVLWGYGGRHVGWGSRHESYGLRGSDVLHHDFQLRHFLHERLEKHGTVSEGKGNE